MPTDPRTAGSLPADPADRSYVSPAALNRVYIALLDLNRRVDSLDGARTTIQPQSITAGSGGMLKVGSITAANIIAGNVVASIMTANAVNAGHIDAVSIRSTILNSAAIITDNLQANILTALQAAIANLSSINTNTGTITAQLVRTDVSPNARVEIGATAGGIKGYNSSNIMTFGFDVTTGAATVGAITVTGANGTSVPASTLTGFVGGGNLLKDSSFESTDPATPGSLWGTFSVTMAKSSTQAFHGSKALQLSAPTNTISQAFSNLTSHGVPLATLQNKPVVMSAWVYVTGTDNGTPGTDRSVGINVSGAHFAAAKVSDIPKNTWTRVIVKATVPLAATDVYAVLYNPYTSGLNTIYYDGVQFEIGDAATAYSPKADEILYGQINTTELAAGAVKASILDAGAVTAGKISLGTAETVSIRNGNFSEGNPADGTSLGNGWTLGSGTAATVQTNAGFGRTARIVHAVSASSWTQQDVTMPVGRNVVRAWIKTTGVTGTGAVLNVDGIGATGTFTDSPIISGTTDWTLVEAIANVTAAGTVRVYIQLGYSGGAAGTAEFANVHVVPAVTGTTLTPNAVETLLVTGGVVRTAASGARVELDSTNGLRAINSSGTTVFQADLLGGVSLTGSVYAKNGMTMDSVNSLTPGVANRIGFLTGATVDAQISGMPGSLLSQASSGGTTGYFQLSPNDARVVLNNGTNTKIIASNGTFTSFVENLALTTQRISNRGSSAISVGANATQTITVSGNAPSATTGFLNVMFLGTNNQRLTWALSGLGTSIDIFNPTGATITGTVYWKWISEI